MPQRHVQLILLTVVKDGQDINRWIYRNHNINTVYTPPLEGTPPSACCSRLAQDMSSSLATVCSRELTEPRSWEDTTYWYHKYNFIQLLCTLKMIVWKVFYFQRKAHIKLLPEKLHIQYQNRHIHTHAKCTKKSVLTETRWQLSNQQINWDQFNASCTCFTVPRYRWRRLWNTYKKCFINSTQKQRQNI